jgi:hypothetical protein
VRNRLQFVLVSTDLSENSQKEVRHHFSHVPILQCFTSAQLEAMFQFKAAKVLGFRKSSLARAVMREMKTFQIQAPSPDPTPGSRGSEATAKSNHSSSLRIRRSPAVLGRSTPLKHRFNKSRSWSDKIQRPPRG